MQKIQNSKNLKFQKLQRQKIQNSENSKLEKFKNYKF